MLARCKIMKKYGALIVTDTLDEYFIKPAQHRFREVKRKYIRTLIKRENNVVIDN